MERKVFVCVRKHVWANRRWREGQVYRGVKSPNPNFREMKPGPEKSKDRTEAVESQATLIDQNVGSNKPPINPPSDHGKIESIPEPEPGEVEDGND